MLLSRTHKFLSSLSLTRSSLCIKKSSFLMPNAISTCGVTQAVENEMREERERGKKSCKGKKLKTWMKQHKDLRRGREREREHFCNFLPLFANVYYLSIFYIFFLPLSPGSVWFSRQEYLQHRPGDLRLPFADLGPLPFPLSLFLLLRYTKIKVRTGAKCKGFSEGF